MSIQFGRWSFEGKPPVEDYMQKVRTLVAPYGPDGEDSYAADGIRLLYRAFHTTSESRSEKQPCVSESGAVITWDGRLDNRADLIRGFRNRLRPESTDLEVVAAAYERWERDCFANLIGDWALSIWNPRDRSLLLAKDFLGTRHLYYALEEDQITWSTVLDPLVLLSGQSFEIDEEYIAGWLGMFPASYRTPYRNILSVPPSSYVHIRDRKIAIHEFWNFDPKKRLRYRNDAEYEEHFRTLFREAVRRRLRSDTPTLAELSGGMDSSSIVCMADTIIADRSAVTPRLDTVSYYDDSEPHWNERPYFARVEEIRGRIGCHIDVGNQTTSSFECPIDRFAATPSSSASLTEGAKRFAACLESQGNRVLLSGIGGDEVLGGVPTPVPELANLLAAGKFPQLVRRAATWALLKRKPLLHVLEETLRAFLPPAFVEMSARERPAAWLEREFVARCRTSLRGDPMRLKFFGPLPSFQENLFALKGLRRQLSCSSVSPRPVYEKRYSYLDRDLLEFLYAIPREQIIRPGQRRSLMRRALTGIVPDEVLNRQRKGFVTRGPLAAVPSDWNTMIAVSGGMITGSLGIVNAPAFAEALQRARQGHDFPLVTLIRTMRLEYWLRHLRAAGLLDLSGHRGFQAVVRLSTIGASAGN